MDYEMQYVCDFANLYGHSDLLAYVDETFHMNPEHMRLSLTFDDIEPEVLARYMHNQAISVEQVADILEHDRTICPFITALIERLRLIGTPEAKDVIYRVYWSQQRGRTRHFGLLFQQHCEDSVRRPICLLVISSRSRHVTV